MTTETDFGVTQPHVTECLGHQKLEEARNSFILFYDPSEAVQPSQHFEFKLLASKNCKRVNFSCVKSTKCGNVLWRPGEMDIVQTICTNLL